MIHRRVFPSIVALLFSLICLSTPIATLAAELVAPGAKVERAAGGFVFTEGPACDANGNVYYLPSGCKELLRVLDNLVKPNGVVGTADGKLLYVADAGDSKTYVYHIEPDGSLTDRRLIAPVGSDGMTLDAIGIGSV